METAASGTTRYGPNGYEKVLAGSTTHRHELGPVIVSRVGITDTVSYVLRDRLGSTVAITAANTSVSERRQFDAFGKARNADFSDRPAGQANLTNTNRGFTGHTQADEVLLVHMNGRVYDQNLGRFLSVDPIVQGSGSQALNHHSYIQTVLKEIESISIDPKVPARSFKLENYMVGFIPILAAPARRLFIDGGFDGAMCRVSMANFS